MDYPMHPELEIGNKFPDLELPDQTGTLRKLSHLLRGFPGTLVFGRGLVDCQVLFQLPLARTRTVHLLGRPTFRVDK